MPRPPAEPVLVGDLSLDSPIRPVVGRAGQRQARLLARLHSVPIGEVVVPLADGEATAQQLARAAWSQVGDRAARHLVDDGLAVPGALPVTGLGGSTRRRCRDVQPCGTLPHITVVIATRDRTRSLQRCLASVAELEYPAFDVVVVDSAPSTDATQALLCGPHDLAFPLRYLRAARPGLALAHNTALHAASGDVVAFTDDDVEVDRHWLSAIADGFADPDVVCVTGLILPAELETAAQQWVEQAGGFARGYSRQRFSLSQPPADRLFPFTAGRFGSGANMAFRTDWLRARAGFDPATGAGTPARGGDDLIAFLRVILDGGVLLYQPAALVRHWHRRDYAGLRRQSFGYGVGLGAYLTATLWARPTLLAPMLARAVPATAHLVGPHSPKNHDKGHDFPVGLTWRERAGLLSGPVAYAASRWRYRGAATPSAPGTLR